MNSLVFGGVFFLHFFSNTYLKTNIAMENPAFEDVFPMEHGDIRASYVSLPEGTRDDRH